MSRDLPPTLPLIILALPTPCMGIGGEGLGEGAGATYERALGPLSQNEDLLDDHRRNLHEAGPEPGRPGRGLGEPQPHGGGGGGQGRAGGGPGLSPPGRVAPCRGGGVAVRGGGGPGRGVVRYPGALQPPGQDAALHPGHPGGRGAPGDHRAPGTPIPRSPAVGSSFWPPKAWI